VKVHAGGVYIETNQTMIDAQKVRDNNESVATKIWTDLMPILNISSTLTRKFLQKVCKVEEVHPFMEEFTVRDTPVTLLHRLEICTKKGDEIFKKEGIPDETNDSMTSSLPDYEENVTGTDNFLDDGGLCDDLITNFVDASSNNSSTQSEDEDSIPEKDKIEEIYDENPDTNVYLSFTKVMASDSMDKLLKEPNLIVDSMSLMQMGNRDKGSVSNQQKYKSLNGRWFGRNKEKLDEKVQEVIEKGSIVSMDEEGDSWFVVRTVFCISGSKWYMSTKEDNPSWPIDVSKAKKYRLQVSKFQLNVEKDQNIKLFNYNSLLDGTNVRKSVQLVKDINTIKRIKSRINL
jgi:hypothetical protein